MDRNPRRRPPSRAAEQGGGDGEEAVDGLPRPGGEPLRRLPLHRHPRHVDGPVQPAVQEARARRATGGVPLGSLHHDAPCACLTPGIQQIDQGVRDDNTKNKHKIKTI